MDKIKSYADLVTQAEAAVGAVKDPELRRVAFEKILDDLLQGPHTDTRATAHAKTSKAAASKPASAKKEKAKAGGPTAYIEDLASDGFFKKQKTIAEVKVELENGGHHIPMTSLSGPLQKLCQRKVLRRQKIGGEGSKKSFAYSNW